MIWLTRAKIWRIGQKNSINYQDLIRIEDVNAVYFEF